MVAATEIVQSLFYVTVFIPSPTLCRLGRANNMDESFRVGFETRINVSCFFCVYSDIAFLRALNFHTTCNARIQYYAQKDQFCCKFATICVITDVLIVMLEEHLLW